MRKDLHEENRLAWNAATVAHNSHKGDQAAFFRAGGSTLHAEERALLGNLQGLSVVHLQCNAGQDTLSLARLGARVTGVDISDVAIDFARRLTRDAGIAATFECADIFDWFIKAQQDKRRFDVVFSSYGAINWLSDIRAWARGIALILNPGGRFVLIEYHPLMNMFDEHLKFTSSYTTHGQAQSWDEGVGDYVALGEVGLPGTAYLPGIINFQNPYPDHEFLWGIGEVVTALLEADLILTSLQEYPYCNGFKPFHGMRYSSADRCWLLPEGVPEIPLMYSLTATGPR